MLIRNPIHVNCMVHMPIIYSKASDIVLDRHQVGTNKETVDIMYITQYSLGGELVVSRIDDNLLNVYA